MLQLIVKAAVQANIVGRKKVYTTKGKLFKALRASRYSAHHRHFRATASRKFPVDPATGKVIEPSTEGMTQEEIEELEIEKKRLEEIRERDRKRQAKYRAHKKVL